MGKQSKQGCRHPNENKMGEFGEERGRGVGRVVVSADRKMIIHKWVTARPLNTDATLQASRLCPGWVR